VSALSLKDIVLRPDYLANVVSVLMVNQTVREWLNSRLSQSKVDVRLPEEFPPGFWERVPPLKWEEILRSDAGMFGLTAALVTNERLREQVGKRYIEELESIRSDLVEAIDREIHQLRKTT
jgi:hypothetical protein